MKVMEFLGYSLVIGVLGLGVKSCWNSEFSDAAVAEKTAKRKAEAEQKANDAKPRKVSEANGCEVWAFNPGSRWQYFTRCGAATQTTNTWEECRSVTSGKSTRQECTPHSATITQELK